MGIPRKYDLSLNELLTWSINYKSVCLVEKPALKPNRLLNKMLLFAKQVLSLLYIIHSKLFEKHGRTDNGI